MDLRGQAAIFGLCSAITASSLALIIASGNSFSNSINAKIDQTKKETVDGYVEMGLLDDERDMVIKDCEALGDRSEECKQIMEWSYKNGKCNIYFLPEESDTYINWYLDEFKPGLLKELQGNNENYPSLCANKKSINFHYDEKEKLWKYDGYDRHSWSI